LVSGTSIGLEQGIMHRTQTFLGVAIELECLLLVQLQQVMPKIGRIKGVSKVERIQVWFETGLRQSMICRFLRCRFSPSAFSARPWLP
jgi:hypothetical protein